MASQLNGGYVDTAGFVALQGLFTAHVTGNFVTIGPALVFGTSGVIAKLLALPVFCVVVALLRILGRAMAGRPALRPRVLIAIQFMLLLLGCVLAVKLGPFRDGDAAPAVVTGMTLVCAMAIQNAVHRLHLASFPPTTLMTGNTTQLVLDLVDLLHPGSNSGDRAVTRQRAGRMAAALLCFAGGCALAALLFWRVGVWCFAFPLAVILAAFAASLRGGPVQPRPALKDARAALREAPRRWHTRPARQARRCPPLQASPPPQSSAADAGAPSGAIYRLQQALKQSGRTAIGPKAANMQNRVYNHWFTRTALERGNAAGAE